MSNYDRYRSSDHADDFDVDELHSRPRGIPGKVSSTSRLAARGVSADDIASALASVMHGQVQRASSGAAIDDNAAESMAHASNSSGTGLPAHVRQKFEFALGLGLENVRVHNGAESHQAAKSLGAHAYAIGQDIHMAEGQYAPDTSDGEHLLAHEVVHTVQQRGAAPTSQTKLEVSSPGDGLETEADQLADRMVAGDRTSAASPMTISNVQRQVVHRTPDEDAEVSPAADRRAARAEVRRRRTLDGMDTQQLISLADQIDGEVMNPTGIGPRTRAAKAQTCLRIYEILNERNREAPTAADGTADLDELPTNGDSPLAGELADTPPFGNIDMWAAIASSAPRDPQPLRRPRPTPEQEGEPDAPTPETTTPTVQQPDSLGDDLAADAVPDTTTPRPGPGAAVGAAPTFLLGQIITGVVGHMAGGIMGLVGLARNFGRASSLSQEQQHHGHTSFGVRYGAVALGFQQSPIPDAINYAQLLEVVRTSFAREYNSQMTYISPPVSRGMARGWIHSGVRRVASTASAAFAHGDQQIRQQAAAARANGQQVDVEAARQQMRRQAILQLIARVRAEFPPAGTSRPGQRKETTGRPAQRKANGRASEAAQPESLGAGTSMPDATRARMEAAFNTDFSSVGVQESAAATAIGARAYTQGEQVVFAPGQFDPNSRSGLELLGHELTHVVQQRAGRVASPQAHGGFVNADASLEAEADDLGSRAAGGEQVLVPGSARGGGSATIQRKVIQRVLDPEAAAQSRVQIRTNILSATPAELAAIVRVLENRGAPAVPGPDGEITLTFDSGAYHMDAAHIGPLLAQARGRMSEGDQGPPQEARTPDRPAQSTVATPHMLAAALQRITRIRTLDQLSQQVQAIGFDSPADSIHPLRIAGRQYHVPGSELQGLQTAIEARLAELDGCQQPAALAPSGDDAVCEPTLTDGPPARESAASAPARSAEPESGAPAGFGVIRDFPFPPLNVPSQWGTLELRGMYQVTMPIVEAADAAPNRPDGPTVSLRGGGDQPGRPRQGVVVEGLAAQIGQFLGTDFGGCADEITLDRDSGGVRFRFGVAMPTIHFGGVDLKIRLNLIETERGTMTFRGPSASASLRTVWMPTGPAQWRARVDATYRPNWARIAQELGIDAEEVITTAELGGGAASDAAAGALEGAAPEAASALESAAPEAAGALETVAPEAATGTVEALAPEAAAAAAETAEGVAALEALGSLSLAEIVIPAAIVGLAAYGIYATLTNPHPYDDMARTYGHRAHSLTNAYVQTLRGEPLGDHVFGAAADGGRRLAQQKIAELQGRGISLGDIRANARESDGLYDQVWARAMPHFLNQMREQFAAENVSDRYARGERIVRAYHRSRTGD